MAIRSMPRTPTTEKIVPVAETVGPASAKGISPVPDKSWKAYERRLARRLGTQRIPVTGDRNGADALTPMFAYQFKKRSKSTPPSKSLLAWLDGICEAADRAGGDRVGVVIWQRSQGCLDSESLVVLRLSDWERLHRETKPIE